MSIPEKVVAAVVTEASVKMSDPKYAQTLVGTWVQSQPDAAKYMSASAREEKSFFHWTKGGRLPTLNRLSRKAIARSP